MTPTAAETKASYAPLNEATSHAETDKPFWLKQVKQAIYDTLEVKDEFSANDLKDLEIPQAFANLIGIAVNSVARSGRMKKHGHTTSEFKSRHGAEIKTYLITDYGRSLRTFSGPGRGSQPPTAPEISHAPPSPREAAAPFDRPRTGPVESHSDVTSSPASSESLRLFEDEPSDRHLDADQPRRAA